MLRDLCAEALQGLERRGVTVRATCLDNAVKRDLPLGRSSVELLAEEGQLALTVEVPRSLEQPISVHVLRLASDLVLRQCDVTEGCVTTRVDEDLESLDLEISWGQGQTSRCRVELEQRLQQADAGVPR